MYEVILNIFQVSYNIKLKVDLFGEVLATECECPCGMGPHSTCKHVAAVLLMLAEFSSTGKLPLRGSCTAELQTFHKPRKTYHGNFVKILFDKFSRRNECIILRWSEYVDIGILLLLQ